MAATIGQELREARTGRGIDLIEVERVTKIRGKFLQAMEEDRWEDLPGPPYNRAFLSSYSSFLGLDAEAMVERYKQSAEPPEHVEALPPTVIHSGSLTRPRSARPKALIVAGLVVVILLGVVIGVSLGGSGNGGGDHKNAHRQNQANAKGSGGSSPSTTTPSGTTTTSGTEVSVELQATDLVWVCLVDDQGQPEVNSETLTAGETRGPYEAPAFEATLGNGSVEMTVNGAPAKVPQLAEPLSFRITPEGAHRLSPGAGPTCA